MKLKSIVVNGVLAFVAVLLFVFMSQAYSTASVMGMTENGSGFDMIDFSGEAKSDVLAISNIFVLVFAGLLFVAAVVNILLACGVIKNAKVENVMKLVTLVSAVVAVLFALLAMIMDIVLVNDNKALIESFGGSISVGWACIVNVVLAVVAVGASVYNQVSKK